MDSQSVAALEQAAEDAARVAQPPVRTGDLLTFCQNDIEFWNDQIDQLEDRFSLVASCAKGCGYCCHQLITLSPEELAPLEQFLSTLAPPRREEILTACVLICNTLEEHGIRTHGIISTIREYDQLIEAYFRLHLFCPLLDEERSCSAYPVRPGVCWSYRSYSDPSLCAQPKGSSGCLCFGAFADAAAARLAEAQGIKPGKLLLLPHALRDILSAHELGGVAT